MKRIILLLALLTAINGVTVAQTDMNNIAGQALNAPSASAGEMISQLGNGITPASFNSKWPGIKDDWFKKASQVADVPEVKGLLKTLVSNLKSSAFTADFLKKKGEWLEKLNNSKAFSDIGNLMKDLLGGLNPSALTKEFSQNKDAFTTGLGMLK